MMVIFLEYRSLSYRYRHGSLVIERFFTIIILKGHYICIFLGYNERHLRNLLASKRKSSILYDPNKPLTDNKY